MSASFLKIVPGYDVECDGFSATGIAHFDVTWADYFDADIGGVDGPDVERVELVKFMVNGYKFDRAALLELLGRSAVFEMENGVADDITRSELEENR